ncbi:MAG: hypothetical protein M3437_05410 [Chloroflexota bacterium]|nr:hypothetical protein [Chloroflexota bacterium]MDQ5866190.1 hypothetical protein [Chloroflexota bacterium]
MQQHRPGANPYAGVTTEQDRRARQANRRQVRGVRVRWFTTGVLLGVMAGVLLTIVVSTVVVRQAPLPVSESPGQPDVTISISESYLNRAAAERVASFSTGMDTLTLTELRLDLQPGHRMSIQPGFNVDLGFFAFDTTAIVGNQLAVENGKLVIRMVGDPQLGNMDVPLDALPMDLEGTVASAVDRINNDLLISEINQSLISGFGGSDFTIYGLSTESNQLTVRLRER